MKLTNLAIQQLAGALRWFDGTTQPVLDADKKLVGQIQSIPKVPFKVSYAMGVSAPAVAAQIAVVEALRKKILTVANDGKLGDIPPSHPKFPEVMADIEELMNESVEITVHGFDPELLAACDCAIPPTVIQYLSPLFLAPAKP